MIFKHEPDEYAKNLAEYNALGETDFLPSDGKEAVIGKLKEISLKKKAIAIKQNDIIKEYIELFENGTEKPDKEVVPRLEAFVTSLFPNGDESFPVDAPISLRLCRILYTYYHETGDRDKSIRMIGLGTRCELKMSYTQSDVDFFDFPKMSEEFFPVFGEVSKEMQNALVYAYSYGLIARTDDGFRRILASYQAVDKTIRSCIDQAIDKDFAERCLYTMTANFANVFSDICRRNAEEAKNGRPRVFDIDMERFRKLLEMPLHETEVYFEKNNQNLNNYLTVKTNCYKTYYYLGIISFEELIQKIDDLRLYGEKRGLGEVADFLTVATYLTALYYCSPYDREEKERLARVKIDELMPKIFEMKENHDFRFSWFIMAFLSGASKFCDFSEFHDKALAFTVYQDKALYIHAVMVKEISHLLLARILTENPGYLNGVCGKDTVYIREHKEELLDLMDLCALCHDIGKHFMLEIVSNSSRRLTDDEYETIKSHPHNFGIVCDRDFNESPEQKCIYDCALLHHRWHNGEGGYPDKPHTENRPFVDIIAIADSIDAATDSIGRPYGIGKTLDELIGEFVEMSDRRYSREVAELLCEPEIKAAIEEIITKRREEVNYQIYAFHRI